MAKLFNRAKMDTSTTGSGTITLGSAVNGYQSFANAGVADSDVVQYVIEDGTSWEIGTGTYSATGTSLTRTPSESSNSGAAISLTGEAEVFITAVADDMNRLQNAGTTKVEATSTGATVTGNLAVTGTVDGRDIASDGSKLDGIESGATADQTAAEIRSLVESATDSNVFTDADHTKLNGIESGATADQTASEILTAIKTVDGSGSGLDADTLDGSHASAFLTGNQTITLSGDASGSGTTSIAVSLSADSVSASEIAANAVGASELNVTGNGTTSQFLRSDGDGTFTWATPTDTNTTYSAGTNLSLSGTTFNVSSSPSFTDVYVDDQILSTGDTDTYIQFHAADQWRVVTGGAERLEVNNSAVTVAGVLNVRNALDLADNDIIRLGSGDDWELFCNGSHAYMDLNGGIGNLYIRDGTTTRYTFDDNGSFTATGNITAYSDQRLKENVQPISNALEKVKQLRGVTFDWIETGEHSIGVIAQEVEAVLPELVLTDTESEDREFDTKSVDYGKLTSVLIEAIKEQQKQIEALQETIDGLTK